MRFIKLGIISIVILFSIATAISLLMPGTIMITKSKDIPDDYIAIYNEVKHLNHWKHWIAGLDTLAAPVDFNGKDSVLHIDNTAIFIDSLLPHKINTVWQTGNSKPMVGSFNFIPKANGGYAIHWVFTVSVKWYPWEKFALMLSDKALGPYMQQGLDSLVVVAH